MIPIWFEKEMQEENFGMKFPYMCFEEARHGEVEYYPILLFSSVHAGLTVLHPRLSILIPYMSQEEAEFSCAWKAPNERDCHCCAGQFHMKEKFRVAGKSNESRSFKKSFE